MIVATSGVDFGYCTVSPVRVGKAGDDLGGRMRRDIFQRLLPKARLLPVVLWAPRRAPRI
jgi:hypothetical protein